MSETTVVIRMFPNRVVEKPVVEEVKVEEKPAAEPVAKPKKKEKAE